MICGHSKVMRDLLEKAPKAGTFLNADALSFSLLDNPQSKASVPYKAPVNDRYKNPGSRSSSRNRVSKEISEAVQITPLCLAVNIGCQIMVEAIFKNLKNLNVDLGVSYVSNIGFEENERKLGEIREGKFERSSSEQGVHGLKSQ